MGSCVLHGALPLILVLAPRSFSAPAPPTPVFVEVVSAVPAAPPPPAPEPPKPEPPAPAPEPPPAEKPPRQVVEEAVVVPETPAARPRPKKPDPPKAREKPPEKPPEEPRPSAAELMAQLREQADVDSIGSDVEEASSGAPGVSDPELAAYFRQVKSCLYANWVGARGYQRRRDLSVRFRVRVAPSGIVESVDLLSSSGIRELDVTAERAILKCSPSLPAPPSGISVIPLTFVPGEVQ